MLRLALLLFCLPIVVSAQDASTTDQEVAYRAFLIGGLDGTLSGPVFQTLRSRLAESGQNSVLVFLGDNLECCGLPDSSDAGRGQAEARLRSQLELAEGFAGRVVVVPGNRDWGNPGEDGLAAVHRQEAFVESVLDRGNTFLPDDGFPGPELIDLTDDLSMVVLDTEWWLREGEKSFGDASGRYDIEEEGDLLVHVADVLRRRDDRNLLVIAHHPLLSNGRHGGRFPVREHLFPLTALWDNAYIPLPIVGSLYPLARAWSGGPQDLSHWKYRSLRTTLMGLLEGHGENVVVASGHEQSLQHFPVGHVHQVISGSASISDFVAKGRGAAFASSESGFMEVRYLKDGTISLIAWTPEGIQYESIIHAPSQAVDLPLGLDEAPEIGPNDMYTGAAGQELAAGPVWRAFAGSHYRDAWTTPVTVPVFDVGTEQGGLTPIKRGGGMQTVSLRLEAKDGRQFVLRSLAKNPVQSLPDELKETVAKDILIDQVAIQHPYAALLVPALADAVGVYHTNPKVVFVPVDPRFGAYTDIVGGRLMLFEERPNDDMSHAESFGYSNDVIGAPDMFREVTADNDHRVDQRAYARARLFDIYVADWDRHIDQWRWATFEPEDGQGKIYRPIPRDRDWAFSKIDGLFPTVMQSRFVAPKFQSFKADYEVVRGLVENGLPWDRRILATITPEDWIEIADSMRQALTDKVLASAFDDWPASMRELYESELQASMRSRADALPKAAQDFSRVLDRFVDVVGSDKHEEFVVDSPSPGETRVVVYKTNKQGERRREIYRRTFQSQRSKEIRLYGLGGEDRFFIHGVGRGQDVYVIGGTGDDAFEDHSTSGRGRVYVMDVPNGIEAQAGPSTRLKLSDDALVNRYDEHDYAIIRAVPRVFLGNNSEDGLFLGGGATIYSHRFRKLPYAASHTLVGNYSFSTDAYNVLYGGVFTEMIGRWDVLLDAEARSPNSIRQFFGLGNESANTNENEDFYEAQLSRLTLKTGLRRRMALGSSITVAPFLAQLEVREDEAGFVAVPQPGISASTFEDQLFAGVEAVLDFDRRDSAVLPRHGFHFQGSVTTHIGLNDSSADYTRLVSSFSFFATRTSESKSTIAFRLGAEHRLGDFPFFDASSLGGIENLRGWTSTRFAGRSNVYQNVEVRRRLGHFASVVGSGSYGALAFLDNGRVWTDGESSRIWHQGYGFGGWATMFDAFVMSATLGFSHEQNHLVVGAGFTF